MKLRFLGGRGHHSELYRPRRIGWKPYMRRTGSLSGCYHSSQNRQDVRVHPVQPKMEILSYWLDARIGGGGTGPCLSVYCYGFEVLRFDCFGSGAGHFHITAFMPWVSRAGRFWFSEQAVEAQIERALFELTHNIETYLRLNPRRRVRRMRVDPAAMTTACQEVRAALMSHLERVEILRRLKSLSAN